MIAIRLVFAASVAAAAAVLLIAGCGRGPAPASRSDADSTLPRAAVKDYSPPSAEAQPPAREMTEQDRKNFLLFLLLGGKR